MWGPIIGGIIGGIGSLFGSSDEPDLSGPYNKYGDKLRSLASAYDPYRRRGLIGGNSLVDMANDFYKNPNALQDRIAAGFHVSPYQQHILDSIKHTMGYNSARGGLLGTYGSDKNIADALGDATGRFQDRYIDRGMRTAMDAANIDEMLDRMGLQGTEGYAGLMQRGYQAPLQGQMASAAQSMGRRQSFINNMMGGAALGSEYDYRHSNPSMSGWGRY